MPEVRLCLSTASAQCPVLGNINTCKLATWPSHPTASKPHAHKTVTFVLVTTRTGCAQVPNPERDPMRSPDRRREINEPEPDTKPAPLPDRE